MAAPNTEFRLTVVTQGGKDAPQSFPDGAGAFVAAGHIPVNFHAYAACTQGEYVCGAAVLPERQHVLLLIGAKMDRALKLLRVLKQAGKTVVITIKETGTQQICGHFQKMENWRAFQLLCAEADGALGTTYDSLPLYQSANKKLPVAFIPPPYPVEEEAWDLSRQLVTPRSGVFFGTRQLFVGARNHALALALVSPLTAELNEPLTVISGRASDLPLLRRVFNQVSDLSHAWHRSFAEKAPHIHVQERQIPALDYLRLMARHKLVFQLDASAVPGQVAGDALLCRIPCVGGNGTAERLVFPDLCGHGRSAGDLLDLATRLIKDDSMREDQVQQALELAREKMCFSVARCQLSEFFLAL